jgi:hypothetical protein
VSRHPRLQGPSGQQLTLQHRSHVQVGSHVIMVKWTVCAFLTKIFMGRTLKSFFSWMLSKKWFLQDP